MVEAFTYYVFTLMFMSSFQLSGPSEIGVDALSFSFPQNAEVGKELININFVQFSKSAQSNMQMTDAELISYAKSTFMGTSKPAVSSKERFIFGKKSVGEILTTKIPTPSNLEIHLIQLSDDSKIFIGFKSSTELTAEQTELMISEILGSIKEK